MNNILKFSLAAACSAFALTGCIKETELHTNVTTAESAKQNFDALINGIPTAMITAYTSSYTEHTNFGYPSLMVQWDHAIGTIVPACAAYGGNQYYDRFQPLHYGLALANNTTFTYYIWYNYAQYVKACNAIISTCGDDESMSEVRGVAKAYRALFYLDMARIYEALPAKAPANAAYEAGLAAVAELTVPIVDENLTEDEARHNPRATREEMFEFIFADLDDAEACLANYQPTSKTYPSLPVVYGLKARAYLWLGGFDNSYASIPTGQAAYQKAAEYARKAITASGAQIMSENEWTNPSAGFNTVCSSWLLAMVQTTDTVLSNLHSFAAHMCPEALWGYGSLAHVGVLNSVYDRMSDTDFRKKLILAPDFTYRQYAAVTSFGEEDFMSLSPYTNLKFRPAGGEHNNYSTGNAVSLPVMRIEEMYFIEAEATAHFDETSGRNLLNTFMASRDAKYVAPYSNIVDEIIFQKQVEFWGEGIVFFDYKRLDMGIHSAYPGTNACSGTRFNTEGRAPWWNLCIPLTEVNSNEDIVNNPDPSGAVKSES